MCHGHPREHPCGHQSVIWHYCPTAVIDLETGYQTTCDFVSFAGSLPSTANCPLLHCDFHNAGDGKWTCCNCGARNSTGWCTSMSPNPRWEQNTISDESEGVNKCDHGCCRNCTKDGEPRSVSAANSNRGFLILL